MSNPTVTATLNCARSQLGYQEPGWGDDAPGDQATKYGRWFASWSKQPAYVDTYWCAMFQSWVLSVAGWSVEAGGRFGNCNPWIRWLRGRGMFHSSPKVGALVFFDWDGDGAAEHIGMVESIRPDGRVVTLEGNASVPGRRDGVYRMVRRGGILGYGWLPYGPDPVPHKIVTTKSTGGVPVKAPAGPAGAGPVASRMPGPVAVPTGRAPVTADARRVPWRQCPEMAPGFGGPEDKAQRAWAAYWFALMARFSPGYFAQVVASAEGQREVSRAEVGPVTVRVVEKLFTQVRKAPPGSFHGVIPVAAWSLYQP